MCLSIIADVDYAYWKDEILDSMEDNIHIVDAILMGALVFVVFNYCREYFGKNTTTSTEKCASTIAREDGLNGNAGIGSNCSKIATSNLNYDEGGYDDGRSLNERAEGTNDDDQRRDDRYQEPDSKSVDDCEYRHNGNVDATLSKPDVCDELHAAGLQDKEYLTLLSEIQKMKNRQTETDKLVEELRFGKRASDRITSDNRLDDTRFDRSAADPVRHFECTQNYNALKTDFENLQKINEKLVRKCGAMKLRLEIVERDVTKNQSIIFGGMFCGRYSNFDGPATTRSYADEYYGHPTNNNVVYTSPDPSVRTNDVGGPLPSSSGPPPPPPPPPPSCPPPSAAPAKKPNNGNSDVSDPALKIYTPIPITEEILRTVVLRKPTDVPPKIRVPVGMVPSAKKESNN